MSATTLAPAKHASHDLGSALARALAVVVLAGLALVGGGGRGEAAASPWTSPLDPLVVVRGFEPPAGPYAPGHRGVDLVGIAGQPIRAAGDGVVSFAGQVGGVGAVAVVHGPIRTTYQPVSDRLPVGTTVLGGDPIGVLAPTGSHCAPDPCLHWGARVGDSYVDPLTLLDPGPARLLPYWEDARRPGGPAPGADAAAGVLAEPADDQVPSGAERRGAELPLTGQLVTMPREVALRSPIASPNGAREPLPPAVAAAAAVIGGVGVGAAFLVIRRRRG